VNNEQRSTKEKGENMKRLSLAVLLSGLVFAAGLGAASGATITAESKGKNALAKYLPAGVSVAQASPAQIKAALNLAVKDSPKKAATFLASALSNPKVAKQGNAASAFTKAVLKSAPTSLYTQIIHSVAQSGVDPTVIANAAAAAAQFAPGLGLAIFNAASAGLTPAQQIAIAKAIVAASPQLATAIKQAITTNTGGKVNSNDI
jgi:hypothetical protein